MDIKNLFNNSVGAVIGIDTDREIIHIYTRKTGNKNSISHAMYNYKAKPFTSDFYEKLGAILAQYRQDNPKQNIQKASVVVSDIAVLTDTINIPVINKKAMDNSLTASINNLYGNSSELKFNRVYISQAKQIASYAISAMKKEMLVNLQKACGDQQINVTNVTFASSAATNAAISYNTKLKNASFVILDIKEEFSKVIFVVKGKTLGFYFLPFGYKILYKTRISPEDLLFDHGAAELAVLNAKEKAKAKTLTLAEDEAEAEATAAVADESAAVVVEEDDDWLEILPPRPKLEEEEDEELEAELMAEEESESEFISRGRKKAPRKLPKFMLRPTPTNREDFMYENFRIFMKWTLELIASNPSIVNLGAPEAVYVNMPDEYFFLYEKANIEVEDNGVRFMPLLNSEKKDIVKKNLELYGGFYVNQYNKFNNFHASQLDNIKSRANEKAANKKEDGIIDMLKASMKKVVEFVKKIATYDLTGGGN
ncbi:MAG: hypothetical protein IJX58_03920 [Clostridia bacterium]|nr:hypothetical protein [Clostridia bacterium]